MHADQPLAHFLPAMVEDMRQQLHLYQERITYRAQRHDQMWEYTFELAAMSPFYDRALYGSNGRKAGVITALMALALPEVALLLTGEPMFAVYPFPFILVGSLLLGWLVCWDTARRRYPYYAFKSTNNELLFAVALKARDVPAFENFLAMFTHQVEQIRAREMRKQSGASP